MRLLCLLALLLAPTCRAQLAPSAVAEIPFRYHHHLYVQAELNDSLTAALLLDPVRGLYLDERFARRNGLALLGGAAAGYGAPVYVGGAGAEQVEVRFVRDLAFRLGGQRRAFALTPVIPLDSTMAASLGRSVEGLLGTTVLEDWVVELDFERERLVLHDAAAFVPPTDATLVPIRRTARGRATVPLALQLADGEEAAGYWILDWGMGGAFRATTGFTDAHRLTERLGPGVESDREQGLGGSLSSVVVRPERLRVGAVEVARPVVSLARETVGADAFPEGYDGLIGLGFLARYRVFFDGPGDRLLVVESSRTGAPYRYAETGLRFGLWTAGHDGLTVDTVEADSPAVEAGFAPGDRITHVDGRATRGWVRREVLDALGAGPTTVTVLRGADTLRLRLEPRFPLGR